MQRNEISSLWLTMEKFIAFLCCSCIFIFFCRSMNRGKEIWWMNKSSTQCIVKRVVTGINFSIFMISLKCDKVLENVNFSFFHFTMIFILNSIFFLMNHIHEMLTLIYFYFFYIFCHLSYSCPICEKI